MIVKALRKNIGTIIAALGVVLLCIATFGDLGEFMTEAYWEGVKQNITSIGFLAIALVLIQVSIKQGLAEQALQSGLNTENTTNKYSEHRSLIAKNNERMIYLPYFLQVYNKRHTALKKREFLIDNNFTSEKLLLASGKKKMIKKYNEIKILITAGRIKWTTTDIQYNKHGQIVTLQEHRAKRVGNAVIMSFVFMLGVTLLTRGLFFDASNEPLWQKFVKLLTYIISIGIGSVFSIIKEYEKGAFGVPNDLDEINEIWTEFSKWEIPTWVVKEIEDLNNETKKEVNDEQSQERKADTDGGTDIQAEQEESQSIPDTGPGDVLLIARTDNSVLCLDDNELDRQCDGDTEPT